MQYIMVTNFERHWDNIPENRTFYTIGMFKGLMSLEKLVDGTPTLFIKRKRGEKIVEKCWQGHVYDFLETSFGMKDKIYFTVDIEKEVKCLNKYHSYSEGWHCENFEQQVKVGKNESSGKKVSFEAQKIKDCWLEIKVGLGVSKREFGKKINFVKEVFKRDIIFRDVGHAYVLSRTGFNKPAVILAGSVMEELLRLYLAHKKIKPKSKTFAGYIQACEEKGLLKDAISKLTAVTKYFRNYVHLEKESTKKHSVSKAAANIAVASLFTLINDFEG